MAKKIDDTKMCGAWRCDEFACVNYSQFDYDCNNHLCHVCVTGKKCLNCSGFDNCEYAKENMRKQENVEKTA